MEILLSSTAAVAIAEIGDKTQIATVVLAAKYNEMFWVVTGTTLGMMVANVPVVFAGRWLMDRLPLKYARWGAFAIFLAMALITIAAAMTG
jgi:putative Ca2+/H+ antiporter (TMEM165/GDT1 family)